MGAEVSKVSGGNNTKACCTEAISTFSNGNEIAGIAEAAATKHAVTIAPPSGTFVS